MDEYDEEVSGIRPPNEWMEELDSRVRVVVREAGDAIFLILEEEILDPYDEALRQDVPFLEEQGGASHVADWLLGATLRETKKMVEELMGDFLSRL